MKNLDRIDSISFYYICCYIFIAITSLIGLVLPLFFYIALFFGALASLAYLRSELSRIYRITPYSLLAVNFSLAYIVGPSVSAWYYLMPHTLSPLLLTGPFSFVGDMRWFSIGVALSSLVVAELIFVSELSTNKLFYSISCGQYISRIHERIFLIIMTGIVMFALLSGDIGYGGVSPIGKSSHVTIIGALGITILTALPAIYVMKALRFDVTRLGKLFYSAMVVISLFATIFGGRRYLIYSVLSTVIVFFFYRPNFEKSLRLARFKRFGIKKLLVVFILTITVLSGISYFYALRIADVTYGPEHSISTLVAEGWNIWRSPGYGKYHASAEAESRSGILPGYLGALIDSKTETLDGICMVHAVLDATPRLVLADKSRLLSEYSSCFDKKVNGTIGLPRVDSPITIITQGYVDFGFLGAVSYVIIIGALFFITQLLINLDKTSIFSVFAVSVSLNTLLIAEQGMAFYIVAIRNLVIVFIFSYILRLLLDKAGGRYGGA
jgi:hypothetical protein